MKAYPYLACLAISSIGLCFLPSVRAADGDGLHAGASATNIDPPKLPVVQNGGFAKRMANAVVQSLHARSLVLRSGDERIAICVVDTCMMDRELCDRAKELVAEKTGIATDRILLSATHTHTAPSVMRCLGCPADPEYPDFLVPKIVESIVAADVALQPAQAGWTVADAGDFTNTRRWIYLPHKMKVDPYGQTTVRAMMHPGHANPDTAGPAGPEDPDLTLLSIQTRDGKPLAVLGNLSQHYYARGSLSSGFTGTFCRMLEEQYGGPFVGLMSQGTSGDLQHMDYSKPRAEGIFARADDPYQAYCRALSDLAIEALDKVEHRSDCELDMAEARLTLGRRMPNEERVAWARPIVERLGDELPRSRPEVLATEVFWIQENPEEELKLQALTVGDFGIATLPNEVYGITGLKLKLQSPISTLMNIELANGAVGYIPPPEQHHLGGYTTWPARTAGLEVQAEPKIVDTLLDLMEEITGESRRPLVENIGDHGRKLLDLRASAWWRMSTHSGNRIEDSSGNGNEGKLEPGYALFLDGPQGQGNEFLSTERGNRAVHFAGGRMVADGPELNQGSDYSVSLWFWNAMPHEARQVTGYLFGLGHDGDSKACEQIGISGKALDESGRLLFYNGNDRRETLVGRTTLKHQQWHHLLLVRQGDKVRIYLDGNPKAEIDAVVGDARPDKSTRIFVGGRGDGMFSFEGRMDEVAVFDRALSVSDNPASKVATVAKGRGLPNVLFIGVDDLRPELNCYGASHIKSPNIDRLASEGVLFERAYCQWAVCMPSRASMLSGLRPDSFHGKANAFRQIVPDVVTLPQHFKNHGYFTQSFGKIFHGAWKTAYVGDSFQDPVSWSVERFATGPRYYFSPQGVAKAREVFATSKDRFLAKVDKDPDDPDQWTRYFVRGYPTEAPDVEDHVPQDGQIAEAALDRLRRLKTERPGQPFFLAVGFCKPHLPFVAPKKYWDLYDPDKLPPVPVTERPEGAPAFAIKAGANEVNQYVRDTRGAVTPERTRHLRHGYAACVSYVDALIGRLFDELDSLDLRANTIVVLWSDHGYKLGDFGSWAKHTNFELDTRVPLIISVPGEELPRGKRCPSLVELVDLHPTLSELAGLPVHAGAEGESFAAAVRDPSTPGQEAAYSQFPKGGFMGYTVRTATHRYTEWRDSKKSGQVAARELYKYGQDGIERENLAGRPDQGEVQERLRKLLHLQGAVDGQAGPSRNESQARAVLGAQ